jgi:hypothetical protein
LLFRIDDYFIEFIMPFRTQKEAEKEWRKRRKPKTDIFPKRWLTG